MILPASASPFADLSVVIRALMAALAAWGGRGLPGHGLKVALYRRLSAICSGMERLAARFQAGRLVRRTGPRPHATASVTAEAQASPKPRPARVWPTRIWPARFGWLVRLIGYPAAGHGSQLRAVLEQPEMVALLRAAPQAARLLRPLCRMLAVDPSLLRPPPAGVAAEAAAEAAPKAPRQTPRPAREKMDWGRVPLPRGVLSAARRQGFGKSR